MKRNFQSSVFVTMFAAVGLIACGGDGGTSSTTTLGGAGGATAGAAGSTAGKGGSGGGSAGSSQAGKGGANAGGTDAGGTDAGGTDAGGTDAGGTDAGGSDAGGTDAGGTDAGGTDAGGTDAGGTDAGGTDAGGTDAGGTDAGGTDAGGTDAGGTDAGGTNAGGTDAGGAGGSGAGISEACQGCIATSCDTQFNACAADPACLACATGDPTTAECLSNANLLAAVACACQPSTCAADACAAECTLFGGGQGGSGQGGSGSGGSSAGSGGSSAGTGGSTAGTGGSTAGSGGSTAGSGGSTAGSGGSAGGSADGCSAPAVSPSKGSCIAINASNKCNPVTNAGCTGAGEACDFDGNGGFQCYPPPNDKKICEACDVNNDVFCGGGLTCADSKCAKFCCNDGDCGGGKCDTSVTNVNGLGICTDGSGAGGSGGSAGSGGAGGSGGGAPAGWVCDPAYYNETAQGAAQIFCDCGCGVLDPDCANNSAQLATDNCATQGKTCTDTDTTCVDGSGGAGGSGGSGGSDVGNCCDANGGKGCSIPTIQQCVCAQDSFCCSDSWDATCASEVDQFGCGTCPSTPQIVPQCSGVPAAPPSNGSCVTINASNKCNPITNAGCTAAQACDHDGNGGFQCYAAAAPDNQACGSTCGPDTNFCQGKNTCLTDGQTAGDCARYCCADSDCGASGTCNKTIFGSGSAVGVCLAK